jgi:hypothetical protein
VGRGSSQYSFGPGSRGDSLPVERQGRRRPTVGRPVLPRCSLPYEGNDVYIGWNKDKGAPPLQDLAFDDSGDVYVVPVLVAPTGKESYRAAARIHLGATAGDNQVVRLYSEPLFISGVHEIELDHAQMVFILDKRHWADSMLLCYDRDSGRLERSRSCGELLQGIMPSAFHVSPRDGRISIVSDNNSLIQASSLDAGPSDIQRTDIRGMSYITDIAEDDSNGAIWLAGFHIESRPNAADVLNGATVFFAPAFKAALARVSRDATGPIEPTTLSDYAIAGKEHLSLPLSIVCTDSGP